jgi:hypothetical protein
MKGRAGLEELPGIGRHLSFTLDELVRTGKFQPFNPEDGAIDPEQLLTSLPGVGPYLARQIRDKLSITTLEDLEQAAHDGRLSQIGVGPKRVRGIRDALAGRLGRYRLAAPVRGEPSVAEILAVDQEYRTRAARNQLPTITPRRFNPQQEPWLPLFQTRRQGWRYRVLFSNTALAHRLGQTRDWVVVYFEDGPASGQRTVVTETRGSLQGERVVRGRERECQEYYNSLNRRPAQVEAETAPLPNGGNGGEEPDLFSSLPLPNGANGTEQPGRYRYQTAKAVAVHGDAG